MGLDIGQVFGNAVEAVKNEGSDLLKMGWNAGLGYLEGEAIKILEADKADKQNAFKEGVTNVINRPTSADSFGAYVSNLASQPVIKQYGPYVIGGILLFGVLSVFMGKGE